MNPADQVCVKDEFPIKNRAGQMSIFPQYVPHYTTEHKGDSERISIAFDLILDSDYKQRKNTHNFIVFDDPATL